MGKRILRETRDLLGELLGEGRISFEKSDDVIEVEDDLIRAILKLDSVEAVKRDAEARSLKAHDEELASLQSQLQGATNNRLKTKIAADIEALKARGPKPVIRETSVDSKVKDYIVSQGYPVNASAAAQIYSRDPSGFTVDGNPFTLPPAIPLTVGKAGWSSGAMGPTCMKIADLKTREKGEIGGGEILFSLLTSGTYVSSEQGEADVLLKGENFSLKDMRTGPAKLHPVGSAITEIQEALIQIYNDHLSAATFAGDDALRIRFSNVGSVDSFNAGTSDRDPAVGGRGSYSFKRNLKDTLADLIKENSLVTKGSGPDGGGIEALAALRETLPDIVQGKLDSIANKHITMSIIVLRDDAFKRYEKGQLEFSMLTQNNRIKIIPKEYGTEPFRTATLEAIDEITAVPQPNQSSTKQKAAAAAAKAAAEVADYVKKLKSLKDKNLDHDVKRRLRSLGTNKPLALAVNDYLGLKVKEDDWRDIPAAAEKELMEKVPATSQAPDSISESRLLLAELFPPRRPSLVTELALYSRRGLITEGAKEKAIDAVQFLIGAAVEYGIDVPTLGAGAPLGSAAETVIDAAFAAESITSAVDAIDSVVSKAGKFKDIFNSAMAARTKIKGDLAGFYADVKRIVQEGLELLGKDAQAKVKELAEELGKIVEGMIEKVLDPIGKAIKFLIPDATIGAAAAEAIKALLMELAENCFDMVKGALGAAGKFAKFITDPDAVPNFLEDAIPKLVTFLQQGAKKLEDTSLLKAAVTGGGAGIILKELGPTGLNKLAGILSDKKGDIVGLARKITGTLIPIVFALLALMQVMLKGEYVSEDIEAKREKAKSAAGTAKETPKESKRLRGSVVSETHLLLRELGV